MTTKEERINDVEIKENTEVKESFKINKSRVKIFGVTIWRIFAYIIIYSIVGFFVETIYGTITKGLIESRQIFL